MHIVKLVWDDWNVAHIAKHDVTPNEVEQVCHGQTVVLDAENECLLVIGQTESKRAITVILASRGHETYYVVTARPASRRERRIKGGESND